MKIQCVDVFVVKMPHHYRVAGRAEAPGRLPGTDYYVEPQWVHAYSRLLESCIVKVTADDGQAGWGEVQAPLTPETPCALITTLLGPALLGQNPLTTSESFQRLYQLMLARGHTGSFMLDAMAGLDIALWDLKGRHLREPIFELIGGARQLTLPAYVSGVRVHGLEAKIQAARQLCDAGFAGVKLFSGESVPAVQEELREIRTAIGDARFLALDAIGKYSEPQARDIGRVLDEVNAAWFESPLHAEDIDGHAALAREISTPIAVGETLRTPRQFEPWLRERALAIAQPDIMRCGITGALSIAAQARAESAATTLHTGVCTGIGMAATWQVAATLPSSLPQEHQHDLFAAVGQILKQPLQVDAGRLVVSTEPGIGVDVDEQALMQVTAERWSVDDRGRHLLRPTP